MALSLFAPAMAADAPPAPPEKPALAEPAKPANYTITLTMDQLVALDSILNESNSPYRLVAALRQSIITQYQAQLSKADPAKAEGK